MSAEAWLARRVGEAPGALVETMMAALQSAADERTPIPDRLTEAALSLFSQVTAGSGGREDALPLLAADALLTHAFEAQAEIDPEGLGAFVERQAKGERLAALCS